MDFGRIELSNGEIGLSEWGKVIEETDCLEQAPDRKDANPFTKEEVVFPGEGRAFYCESGEKVGSITLESGALLTTGVPPFFLL